ncbi:MAG: TRAP transporter large permease [Cardiobacteriaceae bacterium]|nr:TRAP transporter large permease [Cardiobacteriaceae bacterium]
MEIELLSILVLFGVFFLLMFLSVPVSFSIGIATISTIALSASFDGTLYVTAQKMITSLDSFALLALPFFILAGNIMNRGGIAMRLINLAMVLAGRMPGALAHCNVIANMLFGSISGSAVAAAAAVGGTMSDMQRKAGYDPSYSAAVNIASCPTGLLIPPSNTFIVYSTISGGTSVAALFLAGYLPGILMGLGIMIVAGIIAYRRRYPVNARVPLNAAIGAFLQAILPLSLIVIVIGGIVRGKFTATEGSAIAVVYSLLLAVVVYREIKIKDLPKLFLDSMITTAIVLLLIGCSSGMSWAMANADIPAVIEKALLAVSQNKIIILLMINFILLIVGLFMDMTPAVLIFTPIFLPIAKSFGVDPVHFGVMMTFNLCMGIITPPVGSCLFVGCSIGKVRLAQVIPYMLPMYIVLVITLLLVTFIPQISLILPQLFMGYGG